MQVAGTHSLLDSGRPETATVMGYWFHPANRFDHQLPTEAASAAIHFMFLSHGFQGLYTRW